MPQRTIKDTGLSKASVAGTSKTGGKTDSTDLVPVRTTLPDEILRHEISDEELGMLGTTRREHIVEIGYVLFGAALGGVMPAIRNLHQSYWAAKTVPLTGLDFIEIALCFGSLVGCAVAIYAAKQKKTAKDTLVESIRARTRSRIAP